MTLEETKEDKDCQQTFGRGKANRGTVTDKITRS